MNLGILQVSEGGINNNNDNNNLCLQQGHDCCYYRHAEGEARSLRQPARSPMGGVASKPKQLSDARMVVVLGSGEDEVNGVFVESERPFVANKSGKPSFVYAGRTRGNAAIVLWWTDAGEQWSIGKFPRSSDVASTKKHLYIASAATGADVGGLLPPSAGWGVSAKATARAMGGPAAYSIEPAPTCRMLESNELPPPDALMDMFRRGVKYAADEITLRDILLG